MFALAALVPHQVSSLLFTRWVTSNSTSLAGSWRTLYQTLT